MEIHVKVEVPELEDLLRVIIAELRALRALLMPSESDQTDDPA